MRRASRHIWGLAQRVLSQTEIQAMTYNQNLVNMAMHTRTSGSSGRTAPLLALEWAPEASMQRTWQPPARLHAWGRRLSTAADGGGSGGGGGDGGASGSGAGDGSGGGGGGRVALGQVGAHPRDRNMAMVFTCK